MPTLSRPDSFNVSFFDEEKARRNLNRFGEYIIGYARLSFDEDGEGYCSIINQQEILRSFYEKKFETPHSQYEFIADDNVSGYKFDRSGLFRVLDKIENGLCNIIIAKDLSRIGRHSALTQLFIEQCERVGIRIVAMDDYDSHKQSDELILGIRAWSNERLVKDTSAKILKIVKHKQENGTWFCAAPFGYRVLDYATGKVEIDEEAAKIVRRIADMYVNGYGINKIARILTEEGVPTPNMHLREQRIAEGKTFNKPIGEKWMAAQISKMLDDDFYIGTLRTGKYRRRGINGNDVRRPVEEQHMFENHHEPILTREIHERIKEIKKTKVKTHDRGYVKNETMFHGILFCGDCGYRLYAYQRKDLATQYVCSNYFKYGKTACTRHTIKEKLLVDIALEYLEHVRDVCKDTIAELDDEVKSTRKLQHRNRVSAEQIQRELVEKRGKLTVIEEQRIKQIIAHPEREEGLNKIYDQMFQQTQQDIEALEKELQILSDVDASEKNSALNKAKTALSIIDGILEKKELLRRDVLVLFDRITVYEDGRVTITLQDEMLGRLMMPERRIVEKPHKQPERVYDVSQTVNVVSDGDPLEIFTDHDGEVVLKKYSPIGEIAAIARDYTDSLYRTLGHVALISDRDAIVSSSGAGKREYVEKGLSPEADQAISGRQQMILNLSAGARLLPITADDRAENYSAQVITPILADGEIVGGLFLLSRDSGQQMTTIDQKVAETTANIIGRQMEQ